MVNLINRRLQEIANGVIDDQGRFFPYRTVTPATGALTVSPSSPNVRYYVKSVKINTRTVAGDTTTSVSMAGTVNGEVLTLAKCRLLPSVAQVVNLVDPSVQVLLDTGTAISISYDNAPTVVMGVVTVAEVEDL